MALGRVTTTRRLRSRLRWRRDEVVAALQSTDRAVVARAFVYFFGLGALLVALVPALPGRQLETPWLVDGAAAVAALTSLAVLLSFERTPDPVLRLLPGLGTVLVTLVLLGGRGDTVPAYSLLYFWVVLTAFYFFGRRLGLAHLLFVFVCFGVALALGDVSQRAMVAVMSVGTLGVTGLMLALLRERADTLILSLDNAARTDALTGALNRRAFDHRLAEELARVGRTNRSFSLLVLDIDRFKQINDVHGHRSGDHALQHLTDVLTRCRRADQVGRLGGDEFAVLLPETDVPGALELADRIFAKLRQRPYGESFALAVSMGISCWPQHGRSAPELCEAADRAMYSAKTSGGHRALTFDASMSAAALPAR